MRPDDDQDQEDDSPWGDDKFDASTDADLMEITPPTEEEESAEKPEESKSLDPWARY